MDQKNSNGMDAADMNSNPLDIKPISQIAMFEKDLLSSCVHCGLCLEVCPTYRLTGDENNSPRGRLRLWRAEDEEKIEQEKWTDFYTNECVGCLACESICPANVPYGKILEETRSSHIKKKRSSPLLRLQAAAIAVDKSTLFNLALLPARAMRQLDILPHPLVFPGAPALFESSATYAKKLMATYRPTGPRVALLTGCLMEALFREINFATIRVLMDNNIQVVIPEDQGCCGAFQEHLGLDGVEALHERNLKAFSKLDVDCVVSNSSGCGLSLKKTLNGKSSYKDVLTFLGEVGPKQQEERNNKAHIYVDLPCHLVHGQKSEGIPAAVLKATGYNWALAPCAKDCCGSGGVYNIQKPENAREILTKKAAFINEAAGDPVIIATANHVCMMQWNSGRSLVKKPFQVKHVIQLLDPESRL